MWLSHSGTIRVAGLIGIILFSFWTGMAPHWDYPYPLHVDEWFAIGYAQAALDAGGLEYTNPFNPGQVAFHPEMGFHMLLGFLKTATGLSWMELYRFAPGVLMALLAFLAYALGSRGGFGWAAALFVTLIPTSIRTLGPVLFVPVAVGMLFILVTLLVLHTMGERTQKKSLWLLMALMGGTIFIHPPTEVVVTSLGALYLSGFVGQSLFQRRFREGLSLLLAIGVRMLIPVLILGFWLPSMSKKVLEQSATTGSGAIDLLGLHSQFPQAFGMLAVSMSVIGVFLFIIKGDGIRSYMLPLFTLLILVFLILFFPIYQLGPVILYSRSWLFLGLLIAIFAGYGVAIYFQSITAIARIAESRFKSIAGGWITVSLWSAGVFLVVVALTTGLVFNEARDQYPQYYHVVDDSVFADFEWIGQHSPEWQHVAMGEPTIAWAYPPVAGPRTVAFRSVSAPWSNKVTDRLREMQDSGEADSTWLRESGVSVFYTCKPRTFSCAQLDENIELFNVRRGVYVVQQPYGAR